MTDLHPTSTVERTADGITVWAEWPAAGVDRPRTMGWGLGPANARTARLAARLQGAIGAGVVFGPATVRTDVRGQTYVEAASRVLGRTMNADLRRLGY